MFDPIPPDELDTSLSSDTYVSSDSSTCSDRSLDQLRLNQQIVRRQQNMDEFCVRRWKRRLVVLQEEIAEHSGARKQSINPETDFALFKQISQSRVALYRTRSSINIQESKIKSLRVHVEALTREIFIAESASVL